MEAVSVLVQRSVKRPNPYLLLGLGVLLNFILIAALSILVAFPVEGFFKFFLAGICVVSSVLGTACVLTGIAVLTSQPGKRR